MTTKSTKRVLSVEEARRQLGISRGLMYKAVRRGEVPSVKIGRRIIIPEAALDKLLQVGNVPTVMSGKSDEKE